MPAIAEEHAESKERELPPLRSDGVNPIDHIFQFHKVSSRLRTSSATSSTHVMNDPCPNIMWEQLWQCHHFPVQ